MDKYNLLKPSVELGLIEGEVLFLVFLGAILLFILIIYLIFYMTKVSKKGDYDNPDDLDRYF